MPEPLLLERMENFSRIRIVERVGQWPRTKGVAKVKNANELFQTAGVPKEPYVPYVPNKQTDPVLQWFRNLPGELIVGEKGLYEFLELDDDDNHEFSRGQINAWQEHFVLVLD